MKKSLMVLALAGAMSAQAVDWKLKTGGNLDEESNWSSSPTQGDTLYVKKTLTGPLTLSGTEVNLFGGAMLRYNGNITVTNDFGAGNAVTNIGAGAGSALHVESGATLVHKSGRIVAYKGSGYDGTYLTGKAKLVLDGPDAIFEQAGGSFILRSNGSTGIDREYLIVTNGATLAISNGLHIGENGKASEGHVIVTGAGTKAVVRGTTSVGFNVGNDGVTNILEVLDGARFVTKKLDIGTKEYNGYRVRVSGEGTTFESTDSVYGRRATMLDILDGARFNARDFQIGHNSTARSGLTVAADAVLYTTRTTAIYKADAVVDGASVIVENGPLDINYSAKLTATNSTIDARKAQVSVDGNAEAILSDSRLCVSNKSLDVYSDGRFFARNSTVSVGPVDTYCSWSGRLGFDGCALEYPRVRLQTAGAELAFTNTVAHGGRIEMTKASTIRIHNSQLRLDEKNATCILMMGAGDSGDNFKRDIYVSGSNSYIYAWGSSYGIYVRGSNTTIHVSIPVEGLSTGRPLFEFKELNFQAPEQRLRVEIDADERLGLDGSHTYTLFKGNNASSSRIDYIYNPTNIAVSVTRFPEQNYSEVYVKVRSKRGAVLLVK